MDKKLKVGFIGTGRISTLHALEYLENPKAELFAICDVDRQTALAQGKAWGVQEKRIFTDYHDLLALKEIDMVEVLLPHHLHRPATLDAIKAGKHVSLQKPMSLDIAEADEMIAAAKKAGVQFKVFENFLFLPQVQKAKELVEAGEIGDLITIRLKSVSANSPDAWDVSSKSWAWHHDRKLSGGGAWLTDDGHHLYAISWYFMGLPEEVHAWTGETLSSSGEMVDLPVEMSWKYSGNRFGSWEAVRAKDLIMNTDFYAGDDRFELTGTKGIIWVNRGHGRMLEIPPVILYRDRQMRAFSDMNTRWDQSFKRSTRHFIDALLNGEPPVLTGEQGRDIMRWCVAAEKSAATGKRVKL
jgi:predicted dehydrogenase